MKKKLLPLLALFGLIAASLLPLGIQKAHAVSYYPGYTCYYRDMAGRCISYQQQRPAYIGGSTTYGTNTRPLYGNRQTYPFRAMFNAYSTNRHFYDNRQNNRYNSVNPYYRAYRYEEDDDDNNYLDDDDDAYDYLFGDDDDDGETGKWKWYYDEDVDYINPYRYQSDDDDGYSSRYYYDDDDDHHYYYDDDDNYGDYDDDYFEYDRNTYYCTGRDCRSNYYRY